jgi:two-component sensor histidine kinase
LDYLLSILSVLVAFALTKFLHLQGTGTVSLFLAAVAVSAWYGGFGPGLFATALTVITCAFFFIPPENSLSLNLNGLIQIVVLTAAAVLISYLNHARTLADRRFHKTLLNEREAKLKTTEAEEHSQFLLDATRLLSSSLDYEGTLQRVGQLSVPRFADWCSVLVVDDDLTVNRFSVSHSDPEKVKLAEKIFKQLTPSSSSQAGAFKVISTGRSLLYEDLPDSFLKNFAQDEEQLSVLHGLGLKSYLCVPLIARHRIIGAISLMTSESGRRFGQSDLDLAQELALTASIAIDNARLYQEAKSSEENLKESLKDKEILLGEIHHRVKNNLQIISSVLNLRSRYVKDRVAASFFSESIDRVKAMALVYERLYQGKNFASVDFNRYILSLVDDLLNVYRSYSQDVKLSIDLPEVKFDVNAAVPLGLLLNELISNSLKHAFPSTAGQIFIRLDQKDPPVLIVGDDGVGLPAELDFETTDCFGMRLVRLLSTQLGASIQVGRPGTTYTIGLPSSLLGSTIH